MKTSYRLQLNQRIKNQIIKLYIKLKEIKYTCNYLQVPLLMWTPLAIWGPILSLADFYPLTIFDIVHQVQYQDSPIKARAGLCEE